MAFSVQISQGTTQYNKATKFNIHLHVLYEEAGTGPLIGNENSHYKCRKSLFLFF